MAGSVRKSEFLWNTQEDTLPPVEMSGKNLWPGKECHSSFRRGSSPKWSNSEASNELKSGDFSRRPSREHLQMKSDVPKDDDISRDRRRMHTDPALDGWDHPYNGHPSDDSFSLPHRGRGKGNIRSTSRDRDQSRSRSRSWSPNQSRDKDRDRDRDMGRSRSRSRDRGRGGGSARGRSRSPFGDDRRESYEYINSRSGPRISSQPCRNFTAGNCRRGNLCKFFHQEHLNSRGGSRSENDVTERWNSRPDNSGASRYGNDRNSVDRSRNKVSDGYKRYSGADEQARDTSKDTSLCKDFQYGRCQRGALCRYPHHVASGDNYKRGNRNVYDDQDRKSQPNRSGNVPCKYFASGRCSRDDCKFSHDGPTSGGFDGRSRNNSLGHNLDDKNKAWNGPSWDEGDASGFSDIAKSNRSFDDKNKSRNGGPSWDDSSASGVSDVAKSKHNMDDKNKSWNGPSWDDSSAQGFSDIVKSNDKLDGRNKLWNDPSWDDSNASGLSDIAKSTAWDGGSVGNLKFRDSAGPEKQSNSKSGQWDGPGWNEKASERNDNLSVTNDAYMATNELGVADKQEPKLIPDGSQSQTLDEISLHPHQQHIIPKDSGCHTTVTRPEVSEISYVQQCRKQGGDNFAMIDDSNPLDVDMVSENADTEVLNLGKGFILSGHNMGSHYPSSLGGNHIFSLNPANGPKIELNGSVEGTLLPLHSLRQTKRHHKEAGEPLEKLEMKVPLVMPVMNETVVSREQVAQLSSLPPSLTQISQTGQLPQAYAELNLANVMGLVYSLPTCASSVLPIDPTFAQSNPDNRSKEQYDIARDIEASKPSNNGVPMEFLSSSTGQVSQMQLEPLSPISTVDPNSSKLQTSGISEEGYKKSPKIKQEEPVNPEINENSIAEKHKHGQENIHPGGSDAQAKLEEGNISNDEKAMRQFKIALVEFVKEILKPTWKEGQMSREVHKTIVKKVVDKVSSTIQGIQIPRTQEKIDQYLAFSKSKITKLVEAYVERFLKG